MEAKMSGNMSREQALTAFVGIMYYGELRGAITFSRFAAQCPSLPYAELREEFTAFMAQQTSDEWRHAALWAEWCARRQLHPPDPPRSIVRLMDCQDRVETWPELFIGTNLIIEGFALHTYPALIALAEGDTLATLQAIHRDETRHVSYGVKWAKVFLEREPELKEKLARTAAQFMAANMATTEETVPLLLCLGVDLGSMVAEMQQVVPRRLEKLGIDAAALNTALNNVRE